MNYYDEFDNNFYYRRKKPKKHIGKFILGLFIGIFSIVGIGAGLFYGIPSIKANMANKLVNDSSIYNEAVSENETLKTNNQTLQEDNQNKDTEIENLNNDKVELNDIIENLSQENDDLSSGNRDLRTQNRDLIQQLSLIQASNNCQITLESQTLALTPDGGGFVWLHSNNTNFGTYYLDDSNVYKSSLISNLINETFDHFNFSHYYRIRVPELGLDTRYQIDKGIRYMDGTKMHINVVDIAGNRYENFDNFGNEFMLKLVIRDIDYETIPNNNSDFNLISLDADIVVMNPTNYTLQNNYICGDDVLTFNESNMTFTYKNYSGRYSRNRNIIMLNQVIDNEFSYVYITSNNSILVGDQMFIANNAHYVEVDETIKQYVNIDPLMFAKENDEVIFNVKDTFTSTPDTVQIVVGNEQITLTPNADMTYSFTMPNEDVRIVASFKDIVFEDFEFEVDPMQTVIDLDLSDVVAGEILVVDNTDIYPEFNIYLTKDTKIQCLNLQLRARYNIYFDGTTSEFNSSFCGTYLENWIDSYGRARYVNCIDGSIRINLNRA